MKKQIIAILALAIAVTISGCVGGGGQSAIPTNVGLAITDFYASTNEVTGCNKAVTLTAEVENKGGHTVKSGDVLACLMGSNFPGETRESLWKNSSSICQNPAKTELGAADVTRNIPGGIASFKWTVTSPDVKYPLTRTDTFTTRVYYKYSSNLATTLWIYNEDELAAAKQRGESMPTVLDVQKTVGPVDISLEIPQYPIVATKDESFTIKVIVSNTGGGTVFNHSGFSWGSKDLQKISLDDLNKVAVNITVPSGLDAKGNTRAQAGYCEADLKDIELRKGESVTIPCDIKLKEDVSTKRSYPISLEATYGYYVDADTSVTVSGKEGQTC